jgi:hypothetical protein
MKRFILCIIFSFVVSVVYSQNSKIITILNMPDYEGFWSLLVYKNSAAEKDYISRGLWPISFSQASYTPLSRHTFSLEEEYKIVIPEWNGNGNYIVIITIWQNVNERPVFLRKVKTDVPFRNYSATLDWRAMQVFNP